MRGKHLLSRLLYLVGITFIGVILSGSIYAQDSAIPLITPESISTLNSTTDIALLKAAARQNGTVRVIVGLNTANALSWGAAGQMNDALRTQSVANLQNTLLNTLGGQARTLRRFSYIPYITLEVDTTALTQLSRSALVSHIQADGYSLPMMNQSASQIGAAGAGGAWELGYTGYGRVLAVLDSGIDTAHSAFAGAIKAEACFSSNGFASDGVSTYTSVCPDALPATTVPGSGVNCSMGVINCEHGTLIAGTVASRNPTYRGIAPDSQIVAVQIFSRVDGMLCNTLGFANPCAITLVSDQLAALEHIYAQRAAYQVDAVVLSVGADYWNSEAQCDADNASRKAITELLQSVSIPVFSPTGNTGLDGLTIAPACISTVFGVGAVDESDAVTDFSNVAPFMDFFAPGKAIHSTYPGGTFKDQDGTSMAAPQVAASYVLLKMATSDLTMAERIDVLKTTGKPINTNGFTIPRIDIKNALQTKAVLLYAPAKGTSVAGTPITFSWKRLPEVNWYRLVLVNTQTAVSSTHRISAADCGADSCVFTAPEVYALNGTYRWRVRAFADTGRRDSLKRPFSVSAATPPTPMSPHLGEAVPQLSQTAWQPVLGAKFYRVIVRDGVTNAKIFKRKFTAPCEPDSCTLTLSPEQQSLFIPGRSYRWHVVAIGTIGRVASPRVNFSIAPGLSLPGVRLPN